MCNLGMAVETMGYANGVENTKIEAIKSLMKTLKLTAEQAMDALQIPKSDQQKYEQKL